MARPRKPKALHIIHGTARADRGHLDQFDLAPGGLGECPSVLVGAAREEWEALTNHREYSRVLTAVDRGMMIRYCHLHGRAMDAITGNGEPLMAAEQSLLHAMAMQMGLTPASRTKLKMPEQKKAVSAWESVKPKVS